MVPEGAIENFNRKRDACFYIGRDPVVRVEMGS
jgi:hypothetical protein